MKKKKLLLGVILSLGILASGCTGSKNPAPVTYSNLSEDSIRFDLDSLMSAAGVSDAARSVFFKHVDQMNQVMEPAWLTQGFTPIGQPRYDAYDLQEAWMKKYPDFLGYNCRITSFSLFGENFLAFSGEKEITDRELLEFDMEALRTDSSALPGKEGSFVTFFSPVVTESTKDIHVHAEKVIEAWKERGISFVPSKDIRMINVFFHYQDGDRNLLHRGKTTACCFCWAVFSWLY